MFSTSKLKTAKEPEIRMKAARRNLQARHKILKKIIRIPNQPFETKISQKSMFSVSKLKRWQKFVLWLPY
jgi:hypothetical protein